jgi:hypothetical protein
VALLSETNLKSHERFYIPNYHFYCTESFPWRNGGTAVAVRKGIPHNHVDLSPFVSVEATGVFIPISNIEVLLAAVYKSPGKAWSPIHKRQTHLVGEMLYKDYYRMCSVEKKKLAVSQGAWRQDELIGGKLPVVK